MCWGQQEHCSRSESCKHYRKMEIPLISSSTASLQRRAGWGSGICHSKQQAGNGFPNGLMFTDPITQVFGCVSSLLSHPSWEAPSSPIGCTSPSPCSPTDSTSLPSSGRIGGTSPPPSSPMSGTSSSFHQDKWQNQPTTQLILGKCWVPLTAQQPGGADGSRLKPLLHPSCTDRVHQCPQALCS